MTEPRNTRILPWSIVAVPAALLLLYVWIYRVNGPEWDHVTSAEIFWRWETHQFTPAFVFKQHNEHRIALPRLAILGLGLLTRWNNEPEMFAHVALMCVTATILFAAFRREPGTPPSRGAALFAFVPAVLMSLSPRSYEAFTGFGFPHYLSILFYVLALRFLVFGDGGGAQLAAAIVCGAATTFSVANGLLIWPFGLAVILFELRTTNRWRATLIRAAIWSAAAAVTIAGYFHNYVRAGNRPDPWYAFEHPFSALLHFLALNGTVFAASVPAAIAFGVAALALYVWTAGHTIADWWQSADRPAYGFWLLTTVLVSNAMVTSGRAEFGPIQALGSRYAAMVALGPIGLYWCLYARRGRWRFAQALTRTVAALMIVGYAVVSLDAWSVAPEWYSRKSWIAYLMYTAKYQPDTLIAQQLYPVVSEARFFSAQMERLRLNVFADPHVSPEGLAPAAARPIVRIDTINGKPRSHEPIVIAAEGAVEVSGYAFSDEGDGPARAVFLTIDGRQDIPAHAGEYRAGARGKPGAKWAGFTGSFGGFVLTPGEHTLALTVVTDDGRHAYVTDPIATIVRR